MRLGLAGGGDLRFEIGNLFFESRLLCGLTRKQLSSCGYHLISTSPGGRFTDKVVDAG